MFLLFFFFFVMFKFCLFVCTLSARCTVACSCKITKVEYNLLIHLEIYIYIYICSKVEIFIEGETIAFCIKEKRPTSRSETRVNSSEERKNMISKLSFIGELSNATLHYMLWKLNN